MAEGVDVEVKVSNNSLQNYQHSSTYTHFNVLQTGQPRYFLLYLQFYFVFDIHQSVMVQSNKEDNHNMNIVNTFLEPTNWFAVNGMTLNINKTTAFSNQNF